jgi:hypothetical protein
MTLRFVEAEFGAGFGADGYVDPSLASKMAVLASLKSALGRDALRIPQNGMEADGRKVFVRNLEQVGAG